MEVEVELGGREELEVEVEVRGREEVEVEVEVEVNISIREPVQKRHLIIIILP